MNTFFTILHGVGLGAVIGAALGLVVGEFAVDFFNVSGIDGTAGFAVVFLYMPTGLLLGAIAGGIIFYNDFLAHPMVRLGLHIVAAAALVWLFIKLTTE